MLGILLLLCLIKAVNQIICYFAQRKQRKHSGIKAM